jgi:hypothetical protein
MVGRFFDVSDQQTLFSKEVSCDDKRRELQKCMVFEVPGRVFCEE